MELSLIALLKLFIKYKLHLVQINNIKEGNGTLVLFLLITRHLKVGPDNGGKPTQWILRHHQYNTQCRQPSFALRAES